MQRKPSFPVANCSIKMPDACHQEVTPSEEEWEPPQRRQQLINFGHSQWGFNNWSWSVSKQDLDFVDFIGGKCTAGVAAFVSVSIKTFEIHRENVGYATALAPNKGSAIHRARKCAVTNALRETLLSFGGSVATELMELLDTNKTEAIILPPQPEPINENNQNILNKQENKNSPLSKTIRKDSSDSVTAGVGRPAVPPVVKGALSPAPPVARAHPMPAAARMPRPPAPLPPQPAQPPHPASHPVRPNSNVSFVLPVMGGLGPPLYPPPRMAAPHMGPPHIFPNAYYEYSAGPWHFTYESFDRHHSNVNLNFNIPPKNLVVNSRTGSECKGAYARPSPGDGEPVQYGPPQGQGCWIKPTIFYDGFWTEQKVKKWVAEQVEKQFPEESQQKTNATSNHDSSTPKS